MDKILRANKLYEELKEEFEKGSPDSVVNKSCNSIDELAVFAMIKFNENERHRNITNTDIIK